MKFRVQKKGCDCLYLGYPCQTGSGARGRNGENAAAPSTAKGVDFIINGGDAIMDSMEASKKILKYNGIYFTRS